MESFVLEATIPTTLATVVTVPTTSAILQADVHTIKERSTSTIQKSKVFRSQGRVERDRR